jgi:hypothetical protein
MVVARHEVTTWIANDPHGMWATALAEFVATYQVTPAKLRQLLDAHKDEHDRRRDDGSLRAAQHSGVFPKADTLWFSRGKHAPSRAWLIAALERIEASERRSAAKSARVDDRARARVEAERRAKALEKAGAARG